MYGGEQMKVSEVKVVLTQDDISNIIEEYVQVEGLEIKSIDIDELINITGSYKWKFLIPFSISVGIGKVHDNVINAVIFNFKVRKIGMPKSVQNLVLKSILKSFKNLGIEADKNNVFIDISVITKFIPFVYFTLKSLELKDNHIEVEASDVIYSQDKQILTINTEETVKKEHSIKLKDSYTKIRNSVEKKVPEKYKPFLEYGLMLPDVIALFYRLFRDERVNLRTKALIGGIIAYFVSPFAISIDFIPFIGEIDELAIAFFGLNIIINDVPEEVILDNWQGKENIILKVEEVINFLTKIIGIGNVKNVINFIGKASKAKPKSKKAQEVSN